MTRAEKIAHNRDEKRITASFNRTCSGVQIDIFDISKVYKAGHVAIATGADDTALDSAIVAFVNTIRKN